MIEETCGAVLQRVPSAIALKLITGDDQSLLDDLKAGLLDAILMSLPVDEADLEQGPLWEYEMVLVVPPQVSVDGGPEALSTLPFILYRRRFVIDGAVRQLCAAFGFQPKIVMENDEPDSVKELVKLGAGISTFASMERCR